MKTERFVITTTARGAKRSMLWNPEHPLRISHLSNWYIEAQETQLVLNQVGKDKSNYPNAPSICLPIPDAFKPSSAVLPNRIGISIRRARSVRPAYLNNPSPQKFSSGKHLQLIAFSGMGKAVLNASPVATAFVGYSRGKPVFTLEQKDTLCEIKPLLEDVRFKLKGQPAQPGLINQKWTLPLDQLLTATLMRGSRWWRFNLINSEHVIIDQSQAIRDDEQGKNFLRVLGVLGGLSLALSAVIGLWPTQERKSEEQAQVPFVKVVLQKTTPPIPKPTPPPAIIPSKILSPAPPPKTLKKTAKPIVEPPKLKPVKIQTPPKLPPPPGPSKSAQRLQSLKDAFGGLSVNTRTIQTSSADVTPPANLFKSSSDSLAPTKIDTTYSAESKKVDTLGSSGQDNLNYGATETNHSGGKGSSLVSLESGLGSKVEPGLSKEEVGQVIQTHIKEIRECHESAMLYDPKLEGKMTIQFTISPMGTLQNIKIQNSTFSSSELEKCLLTKLPHWQFPKPRNQSSVSVSYPFIFKRLE